MSGANAHRLHDGGLVDRGRTVGFSFDGRRYHGFEGDTLASALLGSGVLLMGRSFKYHRPRGPLSAGSEEPNALVEVRTGARREPNTRATTLELFDGLEAASQNRFPSLNFDLMAVNGLLSPVLGAGFYYKTFMWPARFWESLYEPLIRRAAGLGRLSGAADPDHYDKAHAHCDLLIVGSGPAGLVAARDAARAGARVILVEDDFRVGGRLLGETLSIEEAPAHEFAAQVHAELQSAPNVTVMTRTTVFGVYDHGVYGAVQRVTDHLPSPAAHLPRQVFWKLFARRAIVAAGAIERPLVFGGNDRPGVMLAGAVRTYVNRFGVAPGQRTAVFTNNDNGWLTAADLRRSGVDVSAVVDTRADVSPSQVLGEASRLLDDTRILAGARITDALGGKDLHGIEAIDMRGHRDSIAVDSLAVSAGWNPVVHLACHLGAKPQWDAKLQAFTAPASGPPGLALAGAANGVFSTAGALADGARAAASALADLGYKPPATALPVAEDTPYRAQAFWYVAESSKTAFVDFQNDVTVKDIKQSRDEGFRSVEHLKRYTTLGMATDQGKTANVPAIAIMAEFENKPVPEVGTTTFRPPYTPVAIGALAGRSRGRQFRPTRLTPSHAWAEEQGAVFVTAGAWMRAQWFPRKGETAWRESVDREVLATRTGVGLCDVSTLGKIDVQGPDAATFLDRIYANTLSTVKTGRARYGLMLREDGFVMDDGTAARMSDHHYLVTTTTANAVGVFRHMEFCRQVLWPELDVNLISVTDQWAQYSVAGPAARQLLAQLVDAPFDIANEAFPYMSAAELTICSGTPARLFRLSFSGELAYEIAVPARFGDALMRILMEAGKSMGVTPYGTEALGVMRLEKGHPAGNELNGTTTAADLGMGRLVAARKDCIGKALSERPGLVDPDRPVLVGFKPVEPSARLTGGAHFLPVDAPRDAAFDQGYMTSVAYSPTLKTYLGLGFIKRGFERHGETVLAADLVRNHLVEVEIVSPHFLDPKGERLRG